MKMAMNLPYTKKATTPINRERKQKLKKQLR